MQQGFLDSAFKQFVYYKKLGEDAMIQVSDADFFAEPTSGINSIAIIVQHLHGNMVSRWTDFLTSDGEKPWRKRDQEFDASVTERSLTMSLWGSGWQCVFDALESCKGKDLGDLVYIRNQGHTIYEAINRQLCHYAYHVGQIVYLSKMYAKNPWQSLSIPKGKSVDFNKEKFNKEKGRRHFTEDRI